MLLKKTHSGRPGAWLRASLAVLALLFSAGAASAAPCDLKNNAPPFIRHDLTDSYCELCSYGYITVIISNSYQGSDKIAMTVVENLGNPGLDFDPIPTTLILVRYFTNSGPLLSGRAPNPNGTSGSIPTYNSSCIPTFGRLENRPDNNRSNTINALVIINAILPGGAPLFVSCNNLVSLIGAVGFGASLSRPLYAAMTSVCLGGRIRTCD